MQRASLPRGTEAPLRPLGVSVTASAGAVRGGVCIQTGRDRGLGPGVSDGVGVPTPQRGVSDKTSTQQTLTDAHSVPGPVLLPAHLRRLPGRPLDLRCPWVQTPSTLGLWAALPAPPACGPPTQSSLFGSGLSAGWGHTAPSLRQPQVWGRLQPMSRLMPRSREAAPPASLWAARLRFAALLQGLRPRGLCLPLTR